MAKEHTARVEVVNKTDGHFKIQVMHQYTGEKTDDSPWREVPPGETVEMMSVTYYTGLGTFGVDNWIVNGIERREVAADIKVPENVLIKEDIHGKAYIEMRWNSGHGVGSSWKVHTLRDDDGNKATKIVIFPTLIEFQSHSGTSSTGWKPEYDIIPGVLHDAAG